MQEIKRVTGDRAKLTIFYDPFNARIRIDKYAGNLEEVTSLIEQAASDGSIHKVIIKARGEHLQFFLEKGFELEAVIKGFFNGGDLFFMSRFKTMARKNSSYWEKAEKIYSDVRLLKQETANPLYKFKIHKAGPEDAERLASLYEKIFEVYPVPLQKTEYVRSSMASGTVFLYIEKDKEIISAASAEIDTVQGNAELTDCATLPSYRGSGLMKQLLSGLEEELSQQQIYCVYTIARSLSFGMNAAFKQLGYRYGGRLVNNCYIYDKIEDMNVWWKDLSQDD
ncbi:putative beta-lysine N-acetyltransferase [Bacillus salacetis]|uniref:Putative beta-lysine N-acetyltransferase n=1 Tax=Bacillus salacetis TaxID=2315464 RepID=A0A3A1QN34_9BACI|nr:putative beta-lysine N-acetyltransferase [Bacillus salacetis]RIW28509.1 putative beta-lysine N-acetyltransferase [Bacillus salacetis]